MVLSIAYTTERERAMGHTLPMSYTLAYTTEYWMWYNCGAPWIRQWEVLTMGLSTEYTMERAMGTHHIFDFPWVTPWRTP